MKKAFTIVELLVALGLFAAVLAAAGMIFNYSLEAQRTAAATAEIMRTLRAITDQIYIDFQGLQTDGHLILYSDSVGSDNYDALYYFSAGDYQSWTNTAIRSDIARIFLGHSQTTYNGKPVPGNLARDVLLLTPAFVDGLPPNDHKQTSFAACQAALDNTTIGETPDNAFFTAGRPDIDILNTPGDVRRLFAQNVGSFKVEWADNLTGNRINWRPPAAGITSWTPASPTWPKALKFTFMIYDSKRILKGGRTFEYIVYIGK